MALRVWLSQLRRRTAARRRRLIRQRSEFVRLGIARLEDRVVLNGAAIVADVQPGTGSSNPAELTAFDGSYYFAANGNNPSGQSVGRELFRLDADGTVTLVADINLGAAGSSPDNFAVVDPQGTAWLIFAATGPQGRELYQLDANGNVSLLADINPGIAGSDPQLLTEFSGKLYFSAFEPDTGRESYVVNNGGNVSLIADLNPGTAPSNPSALYEFAGSLYFSAEVSGIRHLFREAPSGTSDPILVNLGAGVTDPRDFVTFNSKLYFSTFDPADGRELFAMSVANNGKETVTKVANLDGASTSSAPSDFFVFGSSLYFSATGQSGRELFRLTTAGSIAQLDLAAGPASSSPADFVTFQGDMYFAATVGATRGLWRLTNGSPLTTAAVPLPTGVVLPQEAVFYALADNLYFAADGPAGRELYRMNSARVVTLAADVNSGPASSSPTEAVLLGGKVYFVAKSAEAGRELFVLRGEPSSIRIDAGKLVFTDEGGDEHNRLVISSTGTHLVIVDQNGHTISLLTGISGASGAGTNQVVIPLANLAGITGLDIFTRGGNDSVTFDLSANANSFLGQFVTSTYEGGTNTAVGDKLRFIGDGITKSVYTPDTTRTGSGVVGVSSPTQTLSFSFLSLEPVDFTGMAEARLVTPPTETAADLLAIAPGVDSLDGLIAALVVSGTVGGTTIESGYFFGNQTVVITTGSSNNDGPDSIVVIGAANAHGNTNLTFSSGSQGADTVQVGGNVILTGSLQIHTASLNVQGSVLLGGSAEFVTRDSVVFGSAAELGASQVTIKAGSTIVMADGSQIDAGAGTIGLTANGNITLGRLLTTNGTSSAISIRSLSCSVLDGGDSGGANLVAEGLGAVVTIQAALGVGSAASPLDLAVRHLVVTSGGDQRLHELDNLSSLALNAGSSAVTITAGGQIQDADAALDIHAVRLNLTALAAGTSTSSLQTQIGTLTTVVTAGDLYLQEADGLTFLSASALAAGGDVGIVSLTGNVLVEQIAASGLVTLVASGGSVLRSGSLPVNVTSADLELQASAGIGTEASPLRTTVQRLEASGGAGGVFVANSGNLQIGGISPSLLGLTGLSASGGPLVVTVSGALTTVESITNTGNARIALSATSDLIVQAAVTSAAGAIELAAQRALSVQGTSIGTLSGPLTLTANLGTTPAAGSFSGITLVGAKIGSASGNITLQGQGGAASGHGVLLTASSVGQTGSGNVLLAGEGTGGLAGIAWDSLTLQKSGGSYTFQDTVQGGQLFVLPGNYQVRFLDGGLVTGPVTFQNTGGVVLGNEARDQITFAGGLTSTASPATLQGTVATQGTAILLGPATLVDSVTLLTQGGNVTSGPIQGAGVPLVIDAGQGGGGLGDVTLVSPANVIGNLTITADQLTIFENDDITQGAAWRTTGLTTLNSGAHDIALVNPANVLGPLALAGANIRVVEGAGTDVTLVAWNGVLDIATAGQLQVTGLLSGNGSAALSAIGDVTFTAAGSLISATAANVAITAGGSILLADGSRIDAGAGAIGLTASGNIMLGLLLTTNNTASAISIRSLAGSVLGGGDSGGPNVVAEGLGAVVTIQAAQGVGGAGSPLDLAVRHLVVTSGGDQHLHELDNLSSLALNAGSAAVTITAGGQIQDADAALDIQAARLTITALGAGTPAIPLQLAVTNFEATVGIGGLFITDVGGLELGGASFALDGIQSSGGAVKIVTTGAIFVGEAVSAAGSGTIELVAIGDVSVAAPIASGAGEIRLLATDDILAAFSGGMATATGTILLAADSDNGSGGTIQFAGIIDVGSGQVIFRFSDSDGLLSGQVRGSGGVVKQGPGTLTIAAESQNTYTGTTELLGGTLHVDGAIGAETSAATFFLAGGTTLTGGGDINAPIFTSDITARIVSSGNLSAGDGSAAGFNFAGTLLVASGDNVTLRDADLAQLGLLTMIAGGGQLTAVGGVDVGGGELLTGSGAVSGNVVVRAGGQVSPGASVGVVSTARGDVVLQDNSIYLAEINGVTPGAQHDQINAQGFVDVSGAVLKLSGGTFRATTGTIFTLIENDDPDGIADRVAGQFLGLREGATVRFGGIEATISYVGGTGNDITLTVTDELKIVRLINLEPPASSSGGRSETGGGGTSFTQRTSVAPVIFSESVRPATMSQAAEIRSPALETQAVERLRVFLRVVNEVNGEEEGQPVNLDPRVIDDALGFFQKYRFPNGRYRIYVQEAGQVPRQIIDIAIRDGQAVSPEGQSIPAKQETAAVAPVSPAPTSPAPIAVPDAIPEGPPPKAELPLPAPEPRRGEQTGAIAPGEQDRASSVPAHRWSLACAPVAVSLGLAAVEPNGRARINRLLSRLEQLPRTRFHRHGSHFLPRQSPGPN